MEEVETLKERQCVPTQVSSPSDEVLVESDKCNKCNNFNILLVNQIALYNKANLGYETSNNVKKFDEICDDYKTPKCKTLKL